MRTLNDYFLPLGEFSDLDVVGNTGGPVVVPDDGELIGAYINVEQDIVTPTSFDVVLNGSDTTTDFLTGDLDAAGANEYMTPDARVFVVAGDALELTGNGEGAAGTVANITLVIRR